ncbi:GIY-YIG nuclease family protein [Streptomyces sp. NPDC048504]|uniref:GIY-YIG nuclease family protein n=1 Tax=Streptomyces sp. NPDC048504 TaxID=3365559 RepID=UPI0037116D3C
MWLNDQPTALYRFFDADGALLYVGITADLEKRWSGHQSNKAWWPDVAEKTVKWHADRSSALSAELEAIRSEAPRYNVAGSPWAPGARELEADELSSGQAKEVLRGVELGAQIGDPLFIVDRTKSRKHAAVLVSPDWYERAKAALGDG